MTMPMGTGRALKKLREVNKAPTREERERRRAELRSLDLELRKEQEDAAEMRKLERRIRRDRALAMGSEAVAIVQRYREKGLRAKALRDAVERHARLLAQTEPDMADLLLETPLGSDVLHAHRRDVTKAPRR